jgi:hypothetical protein
MSGAGGPPKIAEGRRRRFLRKLFLATIRFLSTFQRISVQFLTARNNIALLGVVHYVLLVDAGFTGSDGRDGRYQFFLRLNSVHCKAAGWTATDL